MAWTNKNTGDVILASDINYIANTAEANEEDIETNKLEIEEARTDYKGVTHDTLNDRLLQDITDARADLNPNQMNIEYSGTSIDALDSLVGYTKDLTVEGFSVANEIVNNDFSDGTAGWVTPGSILSASSNILTVIGSGSTPYVIGRNTKDTRDGRKAFGYFKGRVTNSNSTSLQLVYGGSPVISKVAEQNIWYELFGIIDIGDDGENLHFDLRANYPDAATANGKVMEIDGNAGVYAINMTKYGIEDYTEEQMLNIVHGMQAGTDIQSCILSEVKSDNGKEITDPDYVKDSNVLDPPVELRRLPNGVTDTVSGDVVTRNIGSRAYQTGDETDTSVITDMTTTLYALTTPTTEAIDFGELQTYPEVTHVTNDSGILCNMSAKIPTNVPALLSRKETEIDALTTLTAAQEASVARLQATNDELVQQQADTQEAVDNIIPLVL